MKFISIIILMLAACSRPKSFDGGKNEIKPGNRVEQPQTFETSDRVHLATARFRAFVRPTGISIPVCEGDVTIRSYSDGSENEGTARCSDPLFALLVREVNLAAKKEVETQTLTRDEKVERNLSQKLTWFKSSGPYVFYPGLPGMLGPAIQDQSTFKNFGVDTPLTITDPKTGESHQGRAKVEVLGINKTFTPEGSTESYDNTLHYVITTEGFSKIKAKADYGIYSRYEVYYQTNPITLLQLNISGPVSDFEPDALKSLGGSLLFNGAIHITLAMREWLRID